SGTALSLQRIIAEEWTEKRTQEVQTHSIRAGEVIGDHEISYFGPSDIIRLEHSAQNRDIFARGAIEAALWLAQKTDRSRDLRTGGETKFSGIIPIDVFFSDLKAAKASV